MNDFYNVIIIIWYIHIRSEGHAVSQTFNLLHLEFIMTVSAQIINLFETSDLKDAVRSAKALVMSKRPNATLEQVEQYLSSIVCPTLSTIKERSQAINYIKCRKPVWGKCDLCGHMEVIGYHYFKKPHLNHDSYEVEPCSKCAERGQIWEVE